LASANGEAILARRRDDRGRDHTMTTDDRRGAGPWLILAGLNGALAMIAGALGAHASAPDARVLVETAAHYQLVHAVALAVVALLARLGGGRLVVASGLAFLLGCVLFSGGLYQ
jgi:uncharacterized membrane protein YgdD (TMEM256/DUF423 family)